MPNRWINNGNSEILFFGPSSQSYGFSSPQVWMWELDHKEGWALKNWCFWTVVLEKILLTVPWTARRSNQSSLKEINLEYLLGELMLKLQYFGHLMLRSHLIGRNPDAGKDWRQKEEVEEDEKVRLHTDSMDRNLSKLWEIVEDRGSSHAEVHGIGKNPTQLSNWTTNCLLGCRWPTSKIPQ